MKKPFFMLVILCISFVLPFNFFVNQGVYAQSNTPTTKIVTFLNGNYDDGDSPKGNKPKDGEFLIVPEPDGITSHGKVGYYNGHSEMNISLSAKTKAYIDFEFKSTSDADYFAVGVRGSNAEVSFPHILYEGEFAGVAVSANQWYKVSVVLDFANEVTTVSLADSNDNILLAPTQSSISDLMDFIVSPTHIRLRTFGNSQVYIDNIVAKEDAPWPYIEHVTGSDGEPLPNYHQSRVVVKMSQDMNSVLPEDITLVRNLDDSVNSASDVQVDSKNIYITFSKPLQSSSVYTLKVSGNAKMTYRTLALGETISTQFKTSPRDIDITDVTFFEDGTNVSCVATLENATLSDASVVVMMSSFDHNGTMTGINYTTVTALASDSAASQPIELPVENGGYVKVLGIVDFNIRLPINNNIYIYKLN